MVSPMSVRVIKHGVIPKCGSFEVSFAEYTKAELELL
jgi:hypothetical protein